MSETPETDAAQIFLGFNPDEGDYFVPVKTAHKLERERDEARETAERYRLEANAMMMQRDSLVEALTSIMPIFNFKYLSHEEKQKVRYASEVIAVVKGGNNE
jgi:hypothetical protein